MEKKMRIKIKSNAVAVYLREFRGATVPNLKWAEILRKIEGKWLEVETDYLFKGQFNTAPIPGVSGVGLRIMENCVEEVENDARREMVRCRYCGYVAKWNKWYYEENEKGAFCVNCEKKGHAEALHNFSRIALEMKSYGLYLRGCGVRGDSESWNSTMVFSNNEEIQKLSDEDLLAIVGWDTYYGGPGRAFTHSPWVHRKEEVVMVKQHGGLDI